MNMNSNNKCHNNTEKEYKDDRIMKINTLENENEIDTSYIKEDAKYINGFNNETLSNDNIKIEKGSHALNTNDTFDNINNNNNFDGDKIDIFVKNNSEDSESDSIKFNSKYNSRDQFIKEDIQNLFIPSIFDDVINGPRGPDVRLHRYNIIIGILKILIGVFATAGIILLTVILLCITINVGYVCVQIDKINSFVQMLFFMYYFDSLYKINRSIWRTYLRLIRTIINSKFGSSMNDIFIKRVLGYFISQKLTYMTLPDRYKTHPKDCICFGYWKITEIVCLMFVGGGAITILSLNFFSRGILYLKFFKRLDEYYYNAPSFVDIKDRIYNQTSYLRIVYCNTNKLKFNTNYINYVLDHLIKMFVGISIASFFFGSFDSNVKKLSFLFGIILVLIPVRFRNKVHRLIVKMKIFPKRKLENNDLHNKLKIGKQVNEAFKEYIISREKFIQYFYNQNNIKNIKKINDDPVENNKENCLKTFVEKENNLDRIHFDSNGDDNDIYNSLHNNANTNRINNKSECIGGENGNIKFDVENIDNKNDNFNTTMNTDDKNIEAILPWNKENFKLWKGCLTVFFVRFIKNIIGVGSMAFLNYYKYSNNIDSSNVKTTNSLLVDIFTHSIFLIALLGQDVIQVIPASSGFMSMKIRKIIFILLLIFEFCLVIIIRITITNNYIPMAFIVIAYSNFSIYPDPRNTWDDENVERKTFLDLFKPNINIQPRISYKHFDKRKGFISKKSKKDIPIMDISLVYNDHENENLYDVLGKEGKYTPSPNAIPMKKDHESCSYNNIYFNQGKKGNEYTNDLYDDITYDNRKEPTVQLYKTATTETQYKRNARARHNGYAILFVTIIVIIASILISIFLDHSRKYKTVPFLDSPNIYNQKPAICQWNIDGITINEFSSLAQACYFKTIDAFTQKAVFISSILLMRKKKIIVVAIRGTSTFEDIFQDIYIWSASVLLQLFGFFGTFIKYWPREFVASLVNFIVKQFTNSRLLYWVDVEKHIYDLKMNTDYTLYLTGHSLGGGVAGVISAHLDIPAITFSSPGLGYSYKTYGIELNKLIRNFVNIIPMFDPILSLDLQVGQIHNIECKSEQPLTCHRIANTVDTLNKMCGEQSLYSYWDDNEEEMVDEEEMIDGNFIISLKK
ncbi:hypothetical protein BCR36DRAFT_375613 [Piromyces finnis]|uniref:Fungal lipase-type domain-containing protein n=1 Tax=Piromyces finnis TaxID=1754191 RepID=A0A1Y1UL40_9FUNG|nr:hypothetical protein BCR36DRAFT_375613 [Piromyces finnis]|eukprot:ORX38770.1 hypothetical protein BCR36DRAFT_375613 [Piromyces finnis]